MAKPFLTCPLVDPGPNWALFSKVTLNRDDDENAYIHQIELCLSLRQAAIRLWTVA